MRLYVIDNGERYSSHALYFVMPFEGDAPEQQRATIETICTLLSEPGEGEYARKLKIVGAGDFEWFEGGKMTVEELIGLESSRLWDWWVDEPDELRRRVALLPSKLQGMVLGHVPDFGKS